MSKETAQEHIQPSYNNEDEITLKELILKLQEFWEELWRNKFWVIAIAGLLSAAFLVNAFLTKPQYAASLTFMVNEDEGGGGSGIGSILGQFGFGGGGKGGQYNLDKILELSKSRKIIREAIFAKATVNNKNDYLANHIIDFYDLHDNWYDDTTGLKNFYFEHDSIAIFNRTENAASTAVYNQIKGTENAASLLSSSYTESTGILILSMNTLSEELSIHFVDTLYSRLSKYYISRAIEPQTKTYNTLKQKTDSLMNRLQSVRYSIAKFSDTNRGLLDNTSSTKMEALRLDQTVTATAYGEAVKNLELADFTLRNETPVFQIIDPPLAPIKPATASKIRAIVIGGFLGGFLAALFFIGRKIVRDAMKE